MIGFRQILIILGVIFLLRLVGKVMTARRNVNDQKNYKQQSKSTSENSANSGKTTISKVEKSKLKESDYTSFEEVD